MEVLQWKLREVLRKKRYLLVYDDVWNENFEKWDMLRRLLIFGGEGSRVIVTARLEKCCMVMSAQIIYLSDMLI